MQTHQIVLFVCIGLGMFAVIGGLALLSNYYTLNGIKSRTVGDGQLSMKIVDNFANRQRFVVTGDYDGGTRIVHVGPPLMTHLVESIPIACPFD